MADWRVSRETIALYPHPNGDNLLLAKLGEYQAVVRKEHYDDGETVIFVPEKSVLPSYHIQEYFAKYLVGSEKNRVKSNKIRGEISMGIIINDIPDLGAIGEDISEKLGITKYEPPIPAQLRGMVEGIRTGGTKLDIGNNTLSHHDCQQFFINKDHFIPEEEVLVTQKLHGTQCILTLINNEAFVSSKGLWKQNLVIKEDDKNSYWQGIRKTDLINKLQTSYPNQFVQCYGELIGTQKGYPYSLNNELDLKLFRLEVEGRIIPYDELPQILKDMWVPIVYRGPFGDHIIPMREGMELVSGKALHITEGIVVSPIIPRYTIGSNPFPLYAKLINPKYKDEESFN